MNELVELSELVLHKGKVLSADTMQEFWPEYVRLRDRAAEMEQEIFERFGRKISAGRKPESHAFKLKRPHVKSRIRHLERLLEDEAFRQKEFEGLDG